MHDDEIPLSIETNSGLVIHEVGMLLEDAKCYNTNLVKCLPLDEKSKLRYPNQKEIDACFVNLEKEIAELSPKIVFLLGEKVYSSVGRHLNLTFDKLDGFNITMSNMEVFVMFQFSIHHTFMYIEVST